MGVISYWIKDPKLELPPLQKISLREAETEGWDEGTKKYAKVQAVERYMSERAEREQQLQTQYANINQQLSTELMDHLEAKPEYVDVDEKKDPIALWKLVIGCVYVRPTGIDQLDIASAINSTCQSSRARTKHCPTTRTDSSPTPRHWMSCGNDRSPKPKRTNR